MHHSLWRRAGCWRKVRGPGRGAARLAALQEQVSLLACTFQEPFVVYLDDEGEVSKQA